MESTLSEISAWDAEIRETVFPAGFEYIGDVVLAERQAADAVFFRRERSRQILQFLRKSKNRKGR